MAFGTSSTGQKSGEAGPSYTRYRAVKRIKIRTLQGNMDWLILLLLMSGDVELNPGPVMEHSY